MIDLTPYSGFRFGSPGSWCGPLTFLGYEFPPAPGPSHAVADGSGVFPSASEGKDRWEPLRASRLGDSLPEGLLFKLDSLQARITGHSEAITFVLARGMMGFSIHRCGDSPAPPIPPRPDEALENTYVVFSLSPVRLLHPSLWGFSSFSYPSSPRWSFASCGSPSSTPRSFVTPRASSFTSAWA